MDKAHPRDFGAASPPTIAQLERATLEKALDFIRPPMLPASTSNVTLLRAIKSAALGLPDTEVAAMLAVPVQSLEFWTRTKEWKAIRKRIELEIQEFLQITVQDMAAKTMRLLDDRITNGNISIRRYKNKETNEWETELYRVPISAADLSNIGHALFDRAERLDRRAKGEDSPEMDSVKKLAERLHRMDIEKEINGEFTTANEAPIGEALASAPSSKHTIVDAETADDTPGYTTAPPRS